MAFYAVPSIRQTLRPGNGFLRDLVHEISLSHLGWVLGSVTHGMSGCHQQQSSPCLCHLKCRQSQCRQDHLGKDSFPEAKSGTIHCGQIVSDISQHVRNLLTHVTILRVPCHPQLYCEEAGGRPGQEIPMRLDKTRTFLLVGRSSDLSGGVQVVLCGHSCFAFGVLSC